MLFVAGSVDQVAGYAKGTRALFEVPWSTRIGICSRSSTPATTRRRRIRRRRGDADRPVARPVAFTHYADAVWDTTRMNNILQHFATAYFGLHLKGEAAMQAYFDVVPSWQGCGVLNGSRGQAELPAHTYWKGFKRGTAVGLMLEHAIPER